MLDLMKVRLSDGAYDRTVYDKKVRLAVFDIVGKQGGISFTKRECQFLALRDKSQTPEFTVGIDAKRTFVDKRSRPNLQQMTQLRHRLD
jgi:hypothetical protein